MNNTVKKGDSKIVAHARRELGMAGTFEKNEHYDGSIGRGTLALVKLFSEWCGSDHAKMETMAMSFNQLIAGELLSPPTTDPDEWETVEGAGEGVVRNKRCPFYASKDNGATWTHIQNQESGRSKNHLSKEEPADEGTNNIPEDKAEEKTGGGNPIGHVNPTVEPESNAQETDQSGSTVQGSERNAGVEKESGEAEGAPESGTPEPEDRKA